MRFAPLIGPSGRAPVLEQYDHCGDSPRQLSTANFVVTPMKQVVAHPPARHNFGSAGTLTARPFAASEPDPSAGLGILSLHAEDVASG